MASAFAATALVLQPGLPASLIAYWSSGPGGPASQGALEPSQGAQASTTRCSSSPGEAFTPLADGVSCRHWPDPLPISPPSAQTIPCHLGPCCGDRWDSLTSCLSLAPPGRLSTPIPVGQRERRCVLCLIYSPRAHARCLCRPLPFPLAIVYGRRAPRCRLGPCKQHDMTYRSLYSSPAATIHGVCSHPRPSITLQIPPLKPTADVRPTSRIEGRGPTVCYRQGPESRADNI